MRQKSGIIRYELVVLFIFLISVTFLKSLRYSLPVYAILAVLPVIKLQRRINLFALCYLLTTSIYLLYGILFQNTYEAIASYISRFLQFSLLLVLLNYKDENYEKEVSHINLIKIATFMEVIIDVLTYITGIRGTQIRLISGNQPVGGNIAITILPLLLYEYYLYEENRKTIKKCYVILLPCVILSGTRGYWVLYLFSSILPFIDYIKGAEEITRRQYIARLFIVSFIVVCMIVLIVFNESILYRINAIFRVGSTTGTRPKENLLALNFFNRTDLIYKLLGIGYGGAPADAPGYYEAFLEAIPFSWGYYGISHFLEGWGSKFHNYYSNTLLLSGLTGILLTIGMFIYGVREICFRVYRMNRYRNSLLLYWVAFFIMLYYRWSCSCGIAEMIVLAYVLKNSESVLEQDE